MTANKWPDPNEVPMDATDEDWSVHDKAVRRHLEEVLDDVVGKAESRVSRIPRGDPDMVCHWAILHLARRLDGM